MRRYVYTEIYWDRSQSSRGGGEGVREWEETFICFSVIYRCEEKSDGSGKALPVFDLQGPVRQSRREDDKDSGGHKPDVVGLRAGCQGKTSGFSWIPAAILNAASEHGVSWAVWTAAVVWQQTLNISVVWASSLLQASPELFGFLICQVWVPSLPLPLPVCSVGTHKMTWARRWRTLPIL